MLSRSIRWAERSKDEAESWPNHTGGVTKAGYFVPPDSGKHNLAWVSESLWTIKHHEWWGAHRKEQGYAIAVFRPRLVNNQNVTDIVDNWLSRTGNKYGWWRLFTFLGEKLTNGKIPFTKLHRKDDVRQVCSNHMAEGMEHGGVTFGERPAELDPDDGMDYCMSHPDEFKFVGWTIVPGRSPA